MKTPLLVAAIVVFLLGGMTAKVYKIIYPQTPSALVWGLNAVAVLAALIILYRWVTGFLQRQKENRIQRAKPLSQKAGHSALGDI